MSAEREVLYRLRIVLARELETINQYEQFADATDDPASKTLFQHLADEEKEHVMEVFEVLNQRDPAQAAWAEGAHIAAIRANRFQEAIAAGEPARGAAPVAPAPSVPAPAPMAPPAIRTSPWRTVGSLYGQAQED